MINRLLLFIVAFWVAIATAYAQQATLRGTVRNAELNEPLPFATVQVVNTSVGAVTDFDGNYTLTLSEGTHTINVSYTGFKTETISISLAAGQVLTRDFLLKDESQMMKELVVVADVARTRETPVAFTTVTLERIQEQVSVQDLPLVLNATPGVYATQQGGGSGDARISIRGFNQRNLAIMVDGIPVNDMENGQVYWSNWSGLSDVTRSMQVQRGLGASKLALPSVGGTINILTKGIEAKPSLMLGAEVGDYGHLRGTIAGTTGRLSSGFGVTFLASYRIGDGWAENTWYKTGTYFFKVEKLLNKHTLGFSVVGSPQEHGQRNLDEPIVRYSKAYARDLFSGSDEEYSILKNNKQQIDNTLNKYNNKQITLAELQTQLAALGVSDGMLDAYENSFIDTTGAKSYGLQYNKNWNVLTRGDGAKEEIITGSRNFYHKPQFMLRDFWSPSNKFSWSNILYASFGNGGGTRVNNISALDANGHINVQQTYDFNTNGLPGFPPSPNTTAAILSSVNNHRWFGALSTFDYQPSDPLRISGGLDLRTYRGYHYRRVEDLMGATFFGSIADSIREGSINPEVGRYYDGIIRWGGMFGEAEYKTGNWTAFLNLTTAASYFRRYDRHFPVVDSITNKTTYIDQFSDSKIVLGFTVKTGANWNFTEHQNLFFNAGYISKAPPFTNVISNANKIFNIVNEKIAAAELGYGLKFNKFAFNANAYYTAWLNRPLTVSVELESGDNEQVNVEGLRAHHRGVEMDFAYSITRWLKWEGTASIGDWVWKTDSTTVLNANSIVGTSQDIQFSANNVHVGDAPQMQFGSLIRIEPIKNLYFTAQYMYNAKFYADFAPNRLAGRYADKESWKIPSYGLLNLSAGYRYDLTKNLSLRANANIVNTLDKVYISDANTTAGFAADEVIVAFGTGRRISGGLTLNFKF